MDYTDFLELERKIELLKFEESQKAIHIEILEDEEIPIDTFLDEGKSLHEINRIYKNNNLKDKKYKYILKGEKYE